MRYRAFVTHGQNKDYEVMYYHNPKRWEFYKTYWDTNPIKYRLGWTKEFKFYDAFGNPSKAVEELPTDKGGIYLFYIKGISLPFYENYILYVGKAEKTKYQNIRKRVKEYFNIPANRYLIIEMFSKWKDYIYCRCFLEINNKQIEQDESLIIQTILPPYNEDIPDKLIPL